MNTELFEIIRTTRSMRRLKPDPVPGDLIRQILEAGTSAASPHRADAYAACRYTIERVKQIAPIWKREYFDGGDLWIEGATADPDDAGARAEAERAACA